VRYVATNGSATDPLSPPQNPAFSGQAIVPPSGKVGAVKAVPLSGTPEGLGLDRRSPPGRYSFIQPGRWVLSPVLDFGNGRSRLPSLSPLGVEVWQWRNVQLIAIAIPGGMGINPYLIYIPLNSRFPCSLEKMKKPGKNFCTYPVENFGSKRPKYRKNER
jgi:hypothetical protein